MPTPTPTRQELVDWSGDDELLFADGFDAALLGVFQRCGQPAVVTYDSARCLAILEGQGLAPHDALEHFTFNVVGAWLGERTPAFLDRATDD